MQIGKRDVLWNYAATVLQIASSVILFPFIIRILPPETVAIWTIFATVISFVGLLDFGFNPSFARNVSYIVSGVKTLKSSGFDLPENNIPEVDYGLLKGLIRTMRLFYSITALFLVLILATIGTYYIHTLLNGYTGNSGEIYAAWGILCIINAYSFYTSYYDALLQGKGLIKRTKQIIIIGQSVYLTAAIILALMGFKLIAIVSAQALSIIIRRIFAYRSIYTTDFKRHIQNAERCPEKNILSAIYPNAVKSGLTGVGGFLVNRSALIVGALYLSLDVIASYGITMQVIGVIHGIAMVYFSTYQPKIVQYRVQNNVAGIKNLYLRGCFFLAITYVICGLPFILCGDWLLFLIGSQTPLLSKQLVVAALLVSLLESNHSLAGGMLMTKNEVPFFKAALISGGFTLLLLIVGLKFTKFGVWGMIMAPGIVQACYQNWKWPKTVVRELEIGLKDVCVVLHDISNYLNRR